jgi:hypothetical protein
MFRVVCAGAIATSTCFRNQGTDSNCEQRLDGFRAVNDFRGVKRLSVPGITGAEDDRGVPGEQGPVPRHPPQPHGPRPLQPLRRRHRAPHAPAVVRNLMSHGGAWNPSLLYSETA